MSEETAEEAEELARRLEEELRRLTVGDVLVQALYGVASLGARRLGEQERDLEQARLAIEALKAVLPLLEGAAAADQGRELADLLASLQLAYAGAVRAASGNAL